MAYFHPLGHPLTTLPPIPPPPHSRPCAHPSSTPTRVLVMHAGALPRVCLLLRTNSLNRPHGDTSPTPLSPEFGPPPAAPAAPRPAPPAGLSALGHCLMDTARGPLAALLADLGLGGWAPRLFSEEVRPVMVGCL